MKEYNTRELEKSIQSNIQEDIDYFATVNKNMTLFQFAHIIDMVELEDHNNEYILVNVYSDQKNDCGDYEIIGQRKEYI